MALTLSIDLGTTNAKVGLVNEDGDILSLYFSGTPATINKEGNTEHDPEALKILIINLVQKALKDNDNDKVEYVAVSSYQFGLMMSDKQRNPLTGITLLTDIRSQETFSDFVSFYDEENLYEKTGCPLISQYVLPRLFYFSQKEREVFEKAKYFTDSKSFLFEWLTGEWVTDMSTAAATQFYNLHDYKWDKKILSKLHLSPDQFPLVKDGTTYLAPIKKDLCKILGLKESVQVVLGLYDGAALAIGLSGLEPDVGIVNIGTTAMLRAPGKKPIFDKNENKRIQAYALQKSLFLNGGALNNAALTLNWMKSNLFDTNLQDSGLSHPNGSSPLMCLPYLTGERDSLIGPFASGVFFGIRKNHTQKDFVRSVLEGVAFSIRYIYDAFLENDLQIKEIRMGGGGANIQAWPQIFADVLDIPVVMSYQKEMALVGSAMLAFTADGKFEDFKEAAQKMLKGYRRIEPDPASVKIREEQYQFFKKLRESLGPLYQEHSKL